MPSNSMDINRNTGDSNSAANTCQEYDLLTSSLGVSVSKHLLNESYTMIWGNDHYYSMIGYSKDEYETKFNNLPIDYFSGHGYQEDLEKILAVIKKAQDKNESKYSINTRMPIKGGGHIWVRMTGTLSNEFIGGSRVLYTVMTDITDVPPEGTCNYEYNALMSTLHVSVSKHLLDESYTLVWANDFYYDLIGYEKEEYEQMFHNRADLYYLYHNYQEDILKISDIVNEAINNGKSEYSFITRMPIKGGGYIWVKMSGTFTNEHINGCRVSYTVITNINDLIKIKTEQSITYNNIPGFVSKFVIKDKHSFKLLEANDNFKKFFNVNDSMELSKDIWELNVENNWPALDSQKDNVKNGKPVHFLVHIQNAENECLWMQLNGECIDIINGNPVYLLIFIDVTDITELREMQKKLKDQAKDLKSALEMAEKANYAKSDFLSRMSHDIRTPMNAIMGMTEIAASNINDKEKISNCLNKISISSKHLLGLVNDILDMSKIESGKMTLNNETVFLPELMENVVAIVQPMIKRKNQQFYIRLSNLTHELFYCDSLRLRQCFINILSNANKFTPENGTITINVKETASDSSDTANLIFEFHDNGIGIKPEFISHIFEAFTRENDNNISKIEGSGLGMAITKKIVDLLGGTISVKSELNIGTSFILQLPLRIIERKTEDIKLPHIKILVVDDDEIMCEYTVQTLNDCGAYAEWTDNGREAVRKIVEAHNNKADFDAVILDWYMPDQDGLETARQIRSNLETNVPILMISAYDWTDIKDEARKSGINGFLSKPLFKSTLCYGIYKYVLGADHPILKQSIRDDFDFFGKNILIAEDNKLNQEIVIELLSDTGANIVCTDNGEEAVKSFMESPNGHFNIILMDIQMPKMDGYTAAKIIRNLRREDALSVPILAMTADVFADDVIAAKKAGMNGHISKPFDTNTMKLEIEKFLNLK